MATPPPTGPLVTRDDIADGLRRLGVTPGETLLAHTSLSSLGWVNGGAVAVVQGLSWASAARWPGWSGWVLLLGVGYGSCTSFHLAEYRPPAPLVPDGRPAPGGRLTVPEVPVSSAGFEELGREFERERPVARHGGSRRRPAVPGRGRGGLRRAPAGFVPGLPRPGHLIGGRSP